MKTSVMWSHPTEYAMKEWDKERLIAQLLWTQDQIDKLQAENIKLQEDLEKLDHTIEVLAPLVKVN